MMPTSDSKLLRAFVEARDEAAFAEFVQRRVDFVYAAALRQVGGDSHRAEDITQEVFLKLAREAQKLSEHPALLGWLYTTTRFAAIDTIRSEQRRKQREEAAHAMHSNDTGGDVAWEKLRPVLDAALAELSEPDREVVLARYFDRQPFLQIAEELGISENAAQKRTDRALEKLHAGLTRRQITSTSAALGAVLTGHASMAAPGGLAAAVTQVALAGSILGTASTGSGLFAFMTTGKLGIGIAAVFVFAGLGGAYLSGKTARETMAALSSSRQREEALTERVRDLEQRRGATAERERTADEKNAQLLSTAKQMTTAAESAAAETESITRDVVNRRFKLAQQLVESGDPETALRELIWCYDVGMPRFSSLSAVRLTSVLLFAKLGERYPPALAALRERRDKARQVMVGNERDFDAVQEYALGNSALKNEAENIAYFDQLPPGDPRRRTLASCSRDYLLEQRRYADALEGRPYSLMSSMLELTSARPSTVTANMPDSPAVGQETRTFLSTGTAKDIETLAGAGQLANARKLAERLIAYDPSETTKALIQRHATRAGHPELLAPANSP